MIRSMKVPRALLQCNHSSRFSRCGWRARCAFARGIVDYRFQSVGSLSKLNWTNQREKYYGLKRYENLVPVAIKSRECMRVACDALEQRFSTGHVSVLQPDSDTEGAAPNVKLRETGNMLADTDLYAIIKEYGGEMEDMLRKGMMNDEEQVTRGDTGPTTAGNLTDVTNQRMPNLGYTCDNITLKRTRKLYTSRSCIRKTFESKGIEYISKIALENCLDLLEIIAWNHEHNIHLYRLTSKLFPWSGEYELEELPDYESIRSCLDAAGELARAAGQRVTNHPSHFVKLAATKDSIRLSSIKDLELQSQIFDMMGFSPSHWNKVRKNFLAYLFQCVVFLLIAYITFAFH